MKNQIIALDVLLIIVAGIFVGFGNEDVAHIGFGYWGVRFLIFVALRSSNGEESRPKNQIKP